MSVDNLPFFAPEQAQSGRFSTLILRVRYCGDQALMMWGSGKSWASVGT